MESANRGTFRSWRVWACFAVLVVIVSESLDFLSRLKWLPPLSGGKHLAVGVLVGGSMGFVAMYVRRRRVRRILRQSLIDLGVPVCLECGYQLRGLREPRCPECGAKFDPALLLDNNTREDHRPD